MPVIFFNPISIPLPKDRIYSRLGYVKDTTKITGKNKEIYKAYISEAANLIELKGAGFRMGIKAVDSVQTTLSKGIVFKSKSLAKFLTGCREVLFMGATAGNRIVEYIQSNSSGKDVTSSVVFDAAASETVDAALNWIMSYFNSQLLREGKYLTPNRFSAGYGDFLLDNQKVMFDILKMEELGVSINQNYILTPEKSVTALAGIKEK